MSKTSVLHTVVIRRSLDTVPTKLLSGNKGVTHGVVVCTCRHFQPFVKRVVYVEVVLVISVIPGPLDRTAPETDSAVIFQTGSIVGDRSQS